MQGELLNDRFELLSGRIGLPSFVEYIGVLVYSGSKSVQVP